MTQQQKESFKKGKIQAYEEILNLCERYIRKTNSVTPKLDTVRIFKSGCISSYARIKDNVLTKKNKAENYDKRKYCRTSKD